MAELDLSYPWLPQNDTHAVACCLCGGLNPVERVYSFSLNGSPLSIELCSADDLMYLSPQPGEKYANALYNHPSYFAGGEDMFGHGVDPHKGRETGHLRIEEIRTKGGLPKRLLEIGSGLGYTLEAAQEAGIQAVGVEFSQSSVSASRVRGLDVFMGSIDQPVSKDVAEKGPYDLIALYSVLEHVPNPLTFLQSLRSLQLPGSRLVVRVPKMTTGGPWLSLLDHFWHFTPRSLETLLHSQGYSMTELFDSGSFVATTGERLPSMTAFATPRQ